VAQRDARSCSARSSSWGARAAREDFAAAARVLRQARDLARELQDDEAEVLCAALLERSMAGAAKTGTEGAPVPSRDGR
jgi:hypothetical protein